ncbi:MAG: hypothetical protein ABR525_08465 [Candidatus Limnocylindria bacterium]
MPRHLAAGGHRLPGGLAALVLALAVGGCAAPSADSAAATAITSATTRATPTATTAAPSGAAGTAIPTLGGPAPSPGSVVLPTYFVTFTESRNGAVAVLTTPGSVCAAEARMADGGILTVASLQQPRTADSKGIAAWTYQAVPAPAGVGIYTVVCTYQGRSETVQNRFTVE